jgi:tetratricopeptide (TPR) repeat protein
MFRRIISHVTMIGLLLFVFFTVQGVLVADANSDPSADLTQGKSALEKGDYKNGVQILAKAVEESASDADKKEYLTKTLEVINTATTNMFNNDDQNKNLDAILEIVNSAFGYNCYKNSELLYHQRGSVFRRQNDMDKAIADYNSALKINSNYTPSRFNLALCYYKQKEYKKAYDELDRIPVSDPSFGQTAKEKKDLLLKNFAQYIVK